MNSHKHVRLTYARRLEMVRQMTGQGLSAPQAATVHGVTPSTARKWLGRYLAGGEAALTDASSRPAHSPRAIEPAKALLIVELRRRRLLQVQIARSVGVSESTVSRVLARAGLSKLSDLQPVEPVHSRSRVRRVPFSSSPMDEKPVMFPSGRPSDRTSPLATGSLSPLITIGIVAVALRKASACAVVKHRKTSTRLVTRSAAASASRSALSAVTRHSTT